MLHEYRSNAKKKPATSPELEKLKEEKLDADRKLADVRFPRFCGLGGDKGKHSHEQEQKRSTLRPGV